MQPEGLLRAASSGPDSFQLWDCVQRGLVRSLELQALLQPAVAIEPGRSVESVSGLVDLHFLIFGAEGIQRFLRLLAGDVVAGSELKKDALAIGVADEVCRIVPLVIAKVLLEPVVSDLLLPFED